MIKQLIASLGLIVVTHSNASFIPYDAETVNVRYSAQFYFSNQQLKDLSSGAILANGELSGKSLNQSVLNRPFVTVECERGSKLKIDSSSSPIGAAISLEPEDSGFGVLELNVSMIKDDYPRDLDLKSITIDNCENVSAPTPVNYVKKMRIKIENASEVEVDLGGGFSAKYSIQLNQNDLDRIAAESKKPA